jgi:lysophospholipase L1-like esterase
MSASCFVPSSWHRLARFHVWLLALAVLGAPACTTPAAPPVRSAAAQPEAPRAQRWIPTWVSTQQPQVPDNLPPAPGLAGSILRQIAQPSLGGGRLRVSFSNRFGAEPLRLGAVHVAPSMGASAIDAARGAWVTFDGKRAVVVPPGASIVSDAVALEVAPFANLAVTTAFDAPLPATVTGHAGSRTRSFLLTGADVAAPNLDAGVPVEHWYFLDRIDTWADDRSCAAVILGDSISDGRGSTTDQNNRWPNLLSRRLAADASTAHVAVLNQGAGGNRLLRDGIGPNVLARFDRDVLALPRVRYLIVLVGINDIGTAKGAREKGEPAASAGDLIAGYRQLITRAHDHDLVVYAGTILPFEGAQYFSAEGEADRQAVNDWIRRSGEFDGVIDFDAIARDPAAPARLSARVDGGDHLHPSADGYRIMAEAIDLGLFR